MCLFVVRIVYLVCDCWFVFFFKQKTAYEMRISDWSSDVCSSDLDRADEADGRCEGSGVKLVRERRRAVGDGALSARPVRPGQRALWPYRQIARRDAVVAIALGTDGGYARRRCGHRPGGGKRRRRKERQCRAEGSGSRNTKRNQKQ